MPYTALYRKKRPKKFGEIVGQPHVVRALTNQIISEKVSHAYLFCGTRGTGKTTAAKIFARAVNCERPENGEPCNECDTCLGILSERNLGVAEIDAASNNGVDNIRDLREEVKYPPTEGKYKVYIIDEVHMLSTSAFNALLKTLEEPPAHAMFVLATTDPQKIPATILSRCQRYDFKRITEPDMIATMRKYLDADGVKGVDDEALQVIAGQSDGAVRDALSILDQALSLYNGEPIGEEKIYELLGAVDRRVLVDFTSALAVADAVRLLEIIDAAVKNGRDMSQFAADLIQHFRNVLVAAQTGGMAEQENADGSASGHVRPELLTHWILTFSEAQRDFRYAPNPRTALEVTVLRLCSGNGGVKDDNFETVLTRLAKLESQLDHLIENGITVQAAQDGGVEKDSGRTEEPADSIEADPFPAAADSAPPAPADPAVTAALKKIQTGWDSFCKEFPIALRSMLSTCKAEQDGAFLRIVCDNKSTMAFLKERQKILSEKMKLKYDLPDTVNLAFIVRDAYNKFTKSAPAPEGGNKNPAASGTAATGITGSQSAGKSVTETAGASSAEKSVAGASSSAGQSVASNPFAETAILADEGVPDEFFADATGGADENPPNWDDDWESLGEQVDMSEEGAF